MACVWSRAADIPVRTAGGKGRVREMRVMVPLIDMINHGYEYGVGGGGGGEGGSAAAPAALRPAWDAARGVVAGASTRPIFSST
jgi:hypothetical protein